MEVTVILPNLGWLLSILLSIMSSKARGIYFHSSGPGCGALFTKDIVQRTIKGTSSVSSNFRGNFALLNSTNAWCPLQVNTLQHLTIKLVKPAILSGFEIQGLHSSNKYITSFKLAYQPADQDPMQYYSTNTNPKIFRLAPKDGDEIVHFSLNGTKMKTIRFLPLYWRERICIRVELYGCIPIDGNFTLWSEWSGCSRSCGNGAAVRYRSCSNPTPANGGQNCVGDVLQTKGCVGVYCPVDGGLSDWSNWTECSVRCGPGFQTRTRTCINPLPVHGGKACEGATAEGRRCSTVDCSGGSISQSVITRSESNKYFIPMVGSVALLAFVMLLLVILLLFKRFSKKRKNGEKNVKVMMT